MSIFDFITSYINLPTSIISKKDNSLTFSLPVKEHSCPFCQTVTKKIHDYRVQPIKDTSTIHSSLSIFYRKRRYKCCSCGKSFPENNPFISKYQRMSKAFISAIIHEHSFLSSSSDIARRFRISTPTVQRLFKQISPSSLKLSSSISIDEFKGDAGAKFHVIINDMKTFKCLNILKDRTPEALYASILKYPLDERLKVQHVSIDLSMPFRKLIHTCFPNAKIAADKFHAVRMANDALNTVRKQVQKNLNKKDRKFFKNSRHLMLKREKNLKDADESAALNVMLNYSDKLSAAYALKEEYFNLFESRDSEEFVKRLKRFQNGVEKQEIRVFKTLLKTTIKWKKEIIHGISTGLNNGFTEGCNTTIKTLKRVSYGYRNFENFKRRIIYLLNSIERTVLRKSR